MWFNYFLSYLFQQFKKLNAEFTTIELENRADGSEIQGVLGEMTGATSVIRI
jgi:glutaredoxin 3